MYVPLMLDFNFIISIESQLIKNNGIKQKQKKITQFQFMFRDDFLFIFNQHYHIFTTIQFVSYY